MIAGSFQGGGVEFPAVPEAGETCLYFRGISSSLYDQTSYVKLPAQYGFTANKGGIFRIKYYPTKYGMNSAYASAYLKLTKNNVDIANSEISNSEKVIDIAVEQGDIINAWVKYSGGSSTYAQPAYFVVSILAPDIHAELGKIITTTT